MHDIGGLIWIVIVIFAVVSSITRSARRARRSATAARGSAPSARVQQPVGATQRTSLIAQFAQQMQVAQEQAAVRQTAPQKVVPVQAVPLPPKPAVPSPRAVPATTHLPEPEPMRARSYFAGRGDLVRGIIAAEVLGKPLALRDE